MRDALVEEGGVERGEKEGGGRGAFTPPPVWEEGGVESISGDSMLTWHGLDDHVAWLVRRRGTMLSADVA